MPLLIFLCLVGMILTAVVRSGKSYSRPRTRKPAPQRSGVDDLVSALLVQAAKHPDGAIKVLVPSGRKSFPDQMDFSEWKGSTPAKDGYSSVLSAAALIDGVDYGFHIFLHPERKIWYFTVTGHERDSSSCGTFFMSPSFLWICYERPWNPRLVTFALRRWANLPGTLEVIDKVEKLCPKWDKMTRQTFRRAPIHAPSKP